MDSLSRLRPHAGALLWALACAVAVSWLGFGRFGFSDYATEAQPAFNALIHGHVGAFLNLCPSYGGSLILRAPLALLPSLWGGGATAVYRAVSVPGVIGTVVLGTWLAARMRAHGQGRLAQALTIGVCICAPVAERALEIGHPEELLAAVLAIGAIVAALEGRAGWAGLLLGLAVATKAPALLAVGPVLIAAAPRWRRSAAIAFAVAAVVLAPLAVHGLEHTRTVATTATSTGGIFQPDQVWWFLGTRTPPAAVARGALAGYRFAPAWIGPLTHPLIIVAGVLLALAWLVRRRGRDGEPADVLLLAAAAFHLRCLLDPWNLDYYAVSAVLALLCWEVLARRRPPLFSLALAIAVSATFRRLPYYLDPDQQTALYLAWSVPVAALMTVRALVPGFGLRVAAHPVELARPATLP